MSVFTNIDGIYAKDVELRQGIEVVKEEIGYEVDNTMPNTQYFTGIDVVDGASADVADAEARADLEDIKDYIGYDDTIAGIEADFENKVFTRLAGAKGKSGGTDFNVFATYSGMRRCNLADDGTVNAYYGDAGYTEDGSNGQVMVEIPKCYYKMIPLKLQAQDWEDYEATTWVSGTKYTKDTSVVTYEGAYYICSTTNQDEEFTPANWHEITTLGLMGYHLLKARYYISATMREGFKVHPAFIIKGTSAPQVMTRDYVYIGAFDGIIYDVSASAYLLNDEQVADVTATTGDKLSSIGGVYEREYTYYTSSSETNTITVTAGPKPASGRTASNNLTRHKCTILGQNRGAGWCQMTIEIASLVQLLYAVEYASFNWQDRGAGVTYVLDLSVENCSSFIGSTSSLGNTSGNATTTIDYTGTAQTTSGYLATSYRGIENFFGNIWTFVDGVNIYGAYENGGGHPYICTDGVYTEDRHSDNYEGVGFTVANATSAYIRYFGYGNSKYDWLFMASQLGHTANSSLPVGDWHYITKNLNGHRVAYLGGYWHRSHSAYCGGCYWSLNGTSSTRSRYVGGRLAYGV